MNLVPLLAEHTKQIERIAESMSDDDGDRSELLDVVCQYMPGAWMGADPRGPWFTSAYGRRVYILDPKPEDLHPDDLCHALARIARYGGHCGAVATHPMPARGSDTMHLNAIFSGGNALSVAQHSMLVRFLVEARARAERWLWSAELYCKSLVHDGTEAWLGDVIGPLKGLFPFYKRIERNYEDALLKRLGLSPMTLKERSIIKQADRLALAIERSLYCVNPPDEAEIIAEERVPLPPYAARVIEHVRRAHPQSLTPNGGEVPGRVKSTALYGVWSCQKAHTLFSEALRECPGILQRDTPYRGFDGSMFGGFEA